MRTITINETKDGRIKVSYENIKCNMDNCYKSKTMQVSDEIFKIINETGNWEEECKKLLNENNFNINL